MKVKLIIIGKTKSKFLVDGEAEYLKRLKHYCKFSEYLIKDIKDAGRISKKELVNKEGKLILESIKKSEYVILLDNNGETLSSVEFSKMLRQKISISIKEITFVIGGAFGFSVEVYQRANSKISISKMTFSHQMVRLIFKEQLYRAFTILKGEKYHHE